MATGPACWAIDPTRERVGGSTLIPSRYGGFGARGRQCAQARGAGRRCNGILDATSAAGGRGTMRASRVVAATGVGVLLLLTASAAVPQFPASAVSASSSPHAVVGEPEPHAGVRTPRAVEPAPRRTTLREAVTPPIPRSSTPAAPTTRSRRGTRSGTTSRRWCRRHRTRATAPTRSPPTPATARRHCRTLHPGSNRTPRRRPASSSTAATGSCSTTRPRRDMGRTAASTAWPWRRPPSISPTNVQFNDAVQRPD